MASSARPCEFTPIFSHPPHPATNLSDAIAPRYRTARAPEFDSARATLRKPLRILRPSLLRLGPDLLHRRQRPSAMWSVRRHHDGSSSSSRSRSRVLAILHVHMGPDQFGYENSSLQQLRGCCGCDNNLLRVNDSICCSGNNISSGNADGSGGHL